MVERLKRCVHCRTRYTYQASGLGAPKYNDDRYCHSCKEHIVEAPKEVPIRFRCVHIPQDTVTIDMFLRWEAEREREHREEMERGLADGRVMLPLIRRVLPLEVMIVKGRHEHTGRTFFAKGKQVYVFGEENIATGEVNESEEF